MGRPKLSAPRSEPHAYAPHAADRLDREALLRHLIHDVEAAAGLTAEVGASSVLLDVRVESYRFVLIRLPECDDGPVELSPREQEIARLVARGLPNKVIARVLEISTWTVGTYLRRIYAKLTVSTRAAMVSKLAQLESQIDTAGAAWPPRK